MKEREREREMGGGRGKERLRGEADMSGDDKVHEEEHGDTE